MFRAKNLNYFISQKGILEEIDISFSPGKVYGIFGPNGSGKTSLLKALAGLSPSCRGSVFWQEQCIYSLTNLQRSQLLTLVPQESQLCFDFTLREFVHMGLYATKLQEVAKSQEVNKAMEMMNLSSLAYRSILKLSGGELKRAYLARALVSQSQIWLLDEPSTFLDLKHQQIIWKLLKEIAALGKVIIVATHDLHMARYYCNDVVILKNGKCFVQGMYEKVMKKEVMERVFEVSNLPQGL